MNAPSTPRITLYTSAVCGYCVAAKNFLKSRGLEWNEVRIDTDPAEREKMVALARRTTVPQIFIGDTHVGGYDDMMALHRAGKLEPLLEGNCLVLDTLERSVGGTVDAASSLSGKVLISEVAL